MAGLGIGRAQASAVSCGIACAIAFAGSCSRSRNARTRRVHADVSKAAEYGNTPGKAPCAGNGGPGRIHAAVRTSGPKPTARSAAASGAISGATSAAARVALHSDASCSNADGSRSCVFGKSAGRVYTAVSEPAGRAVGRVPGSDAGCFAVAKCGWRVHEDLWRRNAQGKQRATRGAPCGTSRSAAFFARLFDRKPRTSPKPAETKRAGYDAACSGRAG